MVMMPTKEDYAKRLQALHSKALESLRAKPLTADQEANIDKLAVMAAVESYRDQLAKYWGRGKEPIQALQAMNEFMEAAK